MMKYQSGYSPEDASMELTAKISNAKDALKNIGKI
jgi:hypothetical protein